MENGLRFASYSLVYMVIVCHSKNKTENDYHVFIKLHVIKINYFSIQKHSKKFFLKISVLLSIPEFYFFFSIFAYFTVN